MDNRRIYLTFFHNISFISIRFTEKMSVSNTILRCPYKLYFRGYEADIYQEHSMETFAAHTFRIPSREKLPG